MKPKNMSPIHCKAELFRVGTWTILRLPESASIKLPSRGQVMVEGTINDVHFQMPLEPDGKWSHWLRLRPGMLKSINAAAGDTVSLMMRPIHEWPEPKVPADVGVALRADPRAHERWADITPMARWEWIRWIRATGQPETRRRRIEAARSKLKAGERRPCCWNRNLCTEPYVAKNGVLRILS